jgi:hypothetical protein
VFSKLMRSVCLLLGVTHTALGLVALRAGDWRGAAEGLAVVLLAFVVWFAVPPGAQSLERPRIGTRSLRLGLYCAVIALAGFAGFSFFWSVAQPGVNGGGGSSSLILLVLVLLIPLLHAERRDRANP